MQPKLPLDEKEKAIADKLLKWWQEQQLVTDAQRQQLSDSLEERPGDWRQLSLYAFVVAVSCGVLAFISIFLDDKLLANLKRYFLLSDWAIFLITALVAFAIHYFAYRRQRQMGFTGLSTQVFYISGSLFTATAVTYFAYASGISKVHYPIGIAIAALVYFGTALKLRSVPVWAIGLLALSGWFAAETAWYSNAQGYFMGMNYPLRFLLWSALLGGICWLLPKFKLPKDFVQTTRVFTVLVAFTALWGMGVFGNYGEWERWQAVRQLSMVPWAIAATALSAVAVWAGMKLRETWLRDMGLIFLLINLYSRYFEYFWDHLNKGLFFLFLAASFWLVGRKAEQLWRQK